MVQMPIAKVLEVAKELVDTGKQVKVLWQEEESLAFIAKGRDYRSEFHINPSHELMYQIRGTMNLHYRTPEGREDIEVPSRSRLAGVPFIHPSILKRGRGGTALACTILRPLLTRVRRNHSAVYAGPRRSDFRHSTGWPHPAWGMAGLIQPVPQNEVGRLVDYLGWRYLLAVDPRAQCSILHAKMLGEKVWAAHLTGSIDEHPQAERVHDSLPATIKPHGGQH